MRGAGGGGEWGEPPHPQKISGAPDGGKGEKVFLRPFPRGLKKFFPPVWGGRGGKSGSVRVKRGVGVTLFESGCLCN